MNLPATTKLVIQEHNKRISCHGNHMTRMDTHWTRSLLNVAYLVNIPTVSYYIRSRTWMQLWNLTTGQLFAMRTTSWIFVTLRCVVKGMILNNFPPYVGSIARFPTYFSFWDRKCFCHRVLFGIYLRYQCRRGLDCYWRGKSPDSFNGI